MLVGCQKSVSYVLIPDSYADQIRLYNIDGIVHTIMLAKQGDDLIIVSMRENNFVFEVYETYALPKLDDQVKIAHYYFDDNGFPHVFLKIDDTIQEMKVTKRIGWLGSYYGMEKTYPMEGTIILKPLCFGENNPCPLSLDLSRFLEGPYQDFSIQDVIKTSVTTQRQRKFDSESWISVGLNYSFYRILATHDGTLFEITVHLENGEVIYEMTEIDENVISAKYINDTRTLISIHENNTYDVYNWDFSKALSGTYDGTFEQFHELGIFSLLQTSSKFHLFNDMYLVKTFEKANDLNTLRIYFNSDDNEIGYYFIEDNTLLHQRVK
jgi:hypothetical protein